MTEAQNTKRPGALIAMSGGVDSSVAAWLMQQAGYDCTGITMRLTRNETLGQSGFHTCCSEKDIEDAAEVAFAMDIPYEVLDFTADFREKIIEKFIRVYEMGGTPNPCIDCNRYVKFDALQKRRRQLDFDYVATGHYARRAYDEKTGRYLLKCGLDPKKDQSYVLFHLTQDTLEHMLFPLGELTKPEVRELAREAGFDNAGKSESQDICFVPDGDHAGFIERRCGHTFGPGPIVDMHGKVLGEHRGIDRYTIGQRKGIGVAAGEPLFVFRKDAETNTLVVGTDSETRAATVRANDVNLISVASIDEPLRVTAKTHYRMKAQPGWARIEDHMLVMEFDEPQRAAAPGQALVLYDGDTVVGGGTIVSA